MSEIDPDLRAELQELRQQLSALSRRRRRSRWLLAAAIVGVLVAGGAVAVAAIPDPGTGLIHGCYDNSTGALRVIDPSHESCADGQTALDWNGPGINWRGTWRANVAYAVGDAVAFNGPSYIAVTASTGSRPPSIKWAVLAAGTQAHGAWAPDVRYYAGSVVTYEGSSYRATATSQGVVPTHTREWALVASKGDPGAPGPGAVGLEIDGPFQTPHVAIPGTDLVLIPQCWGQHATLEISSNGDPFILSGFYNGDGNAELNDGAGIWVPLSGPTNHTQSSPHTVMQLRTYADPQTTLTAQLLISSGGRLVTLTAFIAVESYSCVVRATATPTTPSG